MIGWIFLYAFLAFVILITLLIGVASFAMGTVNKDRGWVVFGLRVLLVAVLAIILSCVLAWPALRSFFEHIFK